MTDMPADAELREQLEDELRKKILGKIRLSQYTNGEDGYSSSTLMKLANTHTDEIMQLIKQRDKARDAAIRIDEATKCYRLANEYRKESPIAIKNMRLDVLRRETDQKEKE